MSGFAFFLMLVGTCTLVSGLFLVLDLIEGVRR